MKYDDRLVAFIDILGFGNAVSSTVDSKGNENEEEISKIHEVFDLIQENWIEADTDTHSKRVTIFSDSIVISVKIDEKSQVFYTLLEIKNMIMSLIWCGFLVRGAVVRGKLIHEPSKVFGPALVEAYTLESKAALYPRIILDRELIAAAGKAPSLQHDPETEKKYVSALLEEDSDGMYYIDYFFKASEELDDPDFQFPAYIMKLADIIRRGLMGSVHPSNVDLKVKYSWMRERYNKMVDTVHAGIYIDAGDPEYQNDVLAAYSELKKISPHRK